VNEYLARLRAKKSKNGIPDQPSKPSIPSSEGFESGSGRYIFEKCSEPDLGRCLQCGEPIGPGSREITVRSTGTGQLATVHQDCLSEWQRRGPQ
jgi:hypothetical protein